MKYPMVELGKCCEIINGSTPSRTKKEFWNGNIDWFTPKDLSRIYSKYVDEAPEKITELGYKSCSTTMIPENSLLFTSRAPIGHLAINKRSVCTNQGFKTLVPKENVDVEYLYYAIKQNLPQLENLGNGATFKELSKATVSNFQIPLPPLEEQKRIAAILDAADLHCQKTKELIAKYDELAQALFLDMFGDPVSNPKGWEVKSLTKYGDFKNGLNFGRSESGESIKYLGVGDFKSKYRLDDISQLQYLKLDKFPSDEYLIQNGDLVFVRSNGNKRLVGRCLVIYPNNEKMTFSGFCIRYRLFNQRLQAEYLAHLFRNTSFKNKMLESGQGANIQNINQKILGQLKIPTPDYELQLKFIKQTDLIEKQKAQAEASLQRAEVLFQSLLQRAFKGEL